MLNPSDFSVYIADYGLKTLKKFCKVFLKYNNHNVWSPPEVWADDRNQQEFYDTPAVDVYSFGILLWELETVQAPFKELYDKTMKFMLLEQRMRPLIPPTTDKNLTTLIRRCWQDSKDKRPSFDQIFNYLDKVNFSV